MRKVSTIRILCVLFLLITEFSLAESSKLETWKANEDAAAHASKLAHFSEAEKLLLANKEMSVKLSSEDARLPRTIFDLAQVYRAEGKYSEALPLYARALEIYTRLYGQESREIADTLEGEGELFYSLNDYAQAGQILTKSLAMRQRLLPKDSPYIAQVKNDLGEVYTATGAFDQAEPLLTEAFAFRKQTSSTSFDMAESLEALGVLYRKTGRLNESESSFRDAVASRQNGWGRASR